MNNLGSSGPVPSMAKAKCSVTCTHLAPEALRVAGMVGELDGVDGVHLEAQQLKGEGG